MCYPKRPKHCRCVAGIPRRANGKPRLVTEDMDEEVELGRAMDEISVEGSEASEDEVGAREDVEQGEEEELGEEEQDDGVEACEMFEEDEEVEEEGVVEKMEEEGSGDYLNLELINYMVELMEVILEKIRHLMGI